MSSFTLLSKFINKIPITILVPQQGRDTETFSFDLRRMFTLAGFKTNADSDMTGMNRPEAFMRRITSSNPEVPDVMIITHHDIKFLPPFTFHILPFGLQQPMFLEETNEDRIYHGIEYCLKQINITTTWITDTNLVRPGYCAILVPIK